jgi:DNA (cytosine-5)-methyltransferase 1
MKALGIDPVCPGFALPLGEETLLEMDMSEAAAYWKIPVPIGRRDRKSGAKKRNQLEIEASRLRGFGEHVHVQK